MKTKHNLSFFFFGIIIPLFLPIISATGQEPLQLNWEAIRGVPDDFTIVSERDSLTFAYCTDGLFISHDFGDSWIRTGTPHILESINRRGFFAYKTKSTTNTADFWQGFEIQYLHGYPPISYTHYWTAGDPHPSYTDLRILDVTSPYGTMVYSKVTSGQGGGTSYFVGNQAIPNYLGFPIYHDSSFYRIANKMIYQYKGDSISEYSCPVIDNSYIGDAFDNSTFYIAQSPNRITFSNDIENNNWATIQVPFDTIQSFFKEFGRFYVKTSSGLYYSDNLQGDYRLLTNDQSIIFNLQNFANSHFVRLQDNHFLRSVGNTDSFDSLIIDNLKIRKIHNIYDTNGTVVIEKGGKKYKLSCGNFNELFTGDVRWSDIYPTLNGFSFKVDTETRSVKKIADNAPEWETVYSYGYGENIDLIINDNKIYLFGTTGLYVSEDNGLTWIQLFSDPISYFQSRDGLLLISSDKDLLYSSNQGTNWQTLKTIETGAIAWFYKGNNNTIYIRTWFPNSNAAGAISYFSPDFGQTWEEQPENYIGQTPQKPIIFNDDFLLFQRVSLEFPPEVRISNDSGKSWRTLITPNFYTETHKKFGTQADGRAHWFKYFNGYIYALADNGFWRVKIYDYDWQYDLSTTICEGSSYTFVDMVLTQSGFYSHTYTDTNGCDSLVTLHLTTASSIESHSDLFINQGTFFHGIQICSDTTIVDSLTAIGGCDSIVIHQIRVITEELPLINEIICEGEAYEINGNTYDQTGQYNLLFEDSSGCDSVVILDLSVYPTTTTDINLELEYGESYHDNLIFADTIITENYASQHGCDSIVNTTIHIVTSINNTSNTIETLHVTPNPSENIFQLYYSVNCNTKISIEIYNILGEKIETLVDNQKISQGINHLTIDANKWQTGIYFLQLETKTDKLTTRVIKL